MNINYRWPAHTWGRVNAPPPTSRRSLNRLLAKWRACGSVQDLRKRRPSAREGAEHVCNDDMVDQVRAHLDVESARKADEVGSSARRNPSLKLHQDCQEKTPPPCIQAEEAPKAEKRQQGQETRFLWANQCQVHINAMILKNCY